MDEDELVHDLAGDGVAQLDLPVDPGVGLPLVPDEPHLVDLLVDQRDPAVADLRAGVDLLQRVLPSSHAETVTTAGMPDSTTGGTPRRARRERGPHAFHRVKPMRGY